MTLLTVMGGKVPHERDGDRPDRTESESRLQQAAVLKEESKDARPVEVGPDLLRSKKSEAVADSTSS